MEASENQLEKEENEAAPIIQLSFAGIKIPFLATVQRGSHLSGAAFGA